MLVAFFINRKNHFFNFTKPKLFCNFASCIKHCENVLHLGIAQIIWQYAQFATFLQIKIIM